jgi:hypothetical protein
VGGQRRRCADSRQGPAQPPARRTCSRRRATSATRDARTHQHRYHPAVRRSGRRVTGGRSRFAVASSVDPTTSVGVRRGRVRPLSSCLLGRASRPPQCVLGLPFELLAGAANLGPGPSRVGPCVLPDRSPRTRSDGDHRIADPLQRTGPHLNAAAPQSRAEAARQRRWTGAPRALRKLAATSRVAASAPRG